MPLTRAPAALAGLTVALYWGTVLHMFLRRRRSGAARVRFVPAQRLEQLLWLAWVPLIGAWLVLPWVAAGLPLGRRAWLALPGWSAGWAAGAVRMGGALLAAAALVLTLRCWAHMGRHWRMAIDPAAESRLLVDGPFARVRHPIYALGILMMLGTLVAAPTPAMLVVAGVHWALLYGKARNEERFLSGRFGAAYAEYCRRTPRFVPRAVPWRAAAPSAAPAGPRTDVGRDGSGNRGAPLTQIQRAMLHWERLHPYNAVHAVQLRGPAQPDRLAAAARAVCADVGLGHIVIDPGRGTIAHRPLGALPVTHVRVPDADAALPTLLSEQLNQPFPAGPHHPLRWSVVESAAGDHHHVLLAYRHVIADAYVTERLLEAVLRGYRGRPPRTDLPRLDTAGDVAARWLDGALRRQGTGRTLRAALRLRHEVHRRHRLKEARDGGDETRVVVRRAPPGLAASLHAFCRAQRVSLNDALLAALTVALGERTRAVGSRRAHADFALGLILNLRRGAPLDLSRYFGVALGHAILLPGDPDRPIAAVLADVARARRQQPAEGHAAAAALCFRMARLLWPLLLQPHHRRTYRRTFPIAAGLSPYVVDAERWADLRQDVLRYVRASPPGPGTPLVLAPTILGSELELTLVHRDTTRGIGSAPLLLERVVAQLAALARGSADTPVAPTFQEV